MVTLRPDPGREEFSRQYKDRYGIAHQCCICKRFQRMDRLDWWDWIPQWLDRSPHQTSHSICPGCADQMYGRKESRELRRASEF